MIEVSPQEWADLQIKCKQIVKQYLLDHAGECKPKERQILKSHLGTFLTTTFNKAKIHTRHVVGNLGETPEDFERKKRIEELGRQASEKIARLKRYREEFDEPSEDEEEEVEEKLPTVYPLQASLDSLNNLNFARVQELQAVVLQTLDEIRVMCPQQKEELQNLIDVLERTKSPFTLEQPMPEQRPRFPFMSSSSNTLLQSSLWLPPTSVLSASTSTSVSSSSSSTPPSPSSPSLPSSFSPHSPLASSIFSSSAFPSSSSSGGVLSNSTPSSARSPVPCSLSSPSLSSCLSSDLSSSPSLVPDSSSLFTASSSSPPSLSPSASPSAVTMNFKLNSHVASNSHSSETKTSSPLPLRSSRRSSLTSRATKPSLAALLGSDSPQVPARQKRKIEEEGKLP